MSTSVSHGKEGLLDIRLARLVYLSTFAARLDSSMVRAVTTFVEVTDAGLPQSKLAPAL